VNFNDEEKPGLTKWFILTVWNDALSKAGGHNWINDAWYKQTEPSTPSDFWQLKCGAYIIGNANNNKMLEGYENWHKKLRLTCAGDKLAKTITDKYQELNENVLDIKQRLAEFSDIERLPGSCALCNESSV
jgi:hypothetical protein